MLILTNTTDNIQVVLGGSITTNQLQCVSSWRDITASAYTAGRTVVNTNNTTDVNIVDAPAGSTQRVVDFINIYNRDTVTQTVTVKYDANGTEYILWQGSLASGQILTYVDGIGWSTTTTNNSVGYIINVQALTSSPTDAQTIYFGTLPKAPVTTAYISKVVVPKSGTMKHAEIYCYSGTAGSNEAWSLYVRVNNTTDYLIKTVSSATSERIFSNNALSIPVSAGDIFEIKSVNPTWGTNPLTTIFGGYVYIE